MSLVVKLVISTMETIPMEVEVISREIIKPSTPTPQHLKRLNLSLLDQISPSTYTPLILYYPAEKTSPMAEKVRSLKSTLSVLLAHFYPVAGRIRDNLYIECNDEGVSFLEANVACSLSNVLVHPWPHEVKKLVPIDMGSKEDVAVPLFFVQVNTFECGGFALGMCMSHKIADMGNFSYVITCWANAACNFTKIMQPRLDASTLIPPSVQLAGMPQVDLSGDKTVTRRYVFHSSKIKALVTSITSEQVTRPTRIEAVSALLLKCMSKASLNPGLGRKRSIFAQSINLRSRMIPPLPTDAFGNLVGLMCMEMTVEEAAEASLRELVRRFKEERNNFENNIKKEVTGEKMATSLYASSKPFGELIRSKDVDFYICSSWCKFPFYEADFGWGRPVWASCTSMELKNVIVMMDRIGGDGIEVWLSLHTDHMNELANVEEFMQFASLNPSISP